MATEVKSELWQRLRACRLQNQMTQDDVARALGVSRPAVSQWESDDPVKRTRPDSKLSALADLFRVPLDWLSRDSSDVNDIVRRDSPMQSMPSANRARDFWHATRGALLAQHPYLKGSSDVLVDRALQLRAPLLWGPHLVSFASYHGGEIETVLRHEVAHVLLLERAARERLHRRGLRVHLLLLVPEPLDGEAFWSARTLGVDVVVVEDLATASQWLSTLPGAGVAPVKQSPSSKLLTVR